MDAIHTEHFKGARIEVFPDDAPESPRSWDNLGTMVCWHTRYNLGDAHDFDAPEDFWEWLNGRANTIILPLFLYDHSGITMSTSNTRYPFTCPWDSGQVGYIYVTRADALKEYKRRRLTKALAERVRKVLLAEVDVYDQYLRGDVYGYMVTRFGKDVDSCWGFYGLESCLAEARRALS